MGATTVTAIRIAVCAMLAMGALAGSAAAMAPAPALVFINEIHYDNAVGDVDEAVEVAGPAGTDLSGWSVVLYNGSGGVAYDTDPLTGVLSDQAAGMGTAFVAYPSNGIQNGAPDGVALVDPAGAVVQFLSYEGVVTATNGPAVGLVSTDIGVAEAGTEPVGQSLQLTGTGRVAQDFTWTAPAAATLGRPNTGQTFTPAGADSAPSVVATNPVDGATGVDAAANLTVSFNEPVTVVGEWNRLVCDASGVVTTTESGGPTDFVLDPAADLAQGERCTLTIVAAQVADVDTADPPDVMDADRVVSFTVFAPPCFAADTPIGVVQGPGDAAAIVGPVTVQGVVVGDYEGPSPTLRGFYLQDTGDGDPSTSDGIFVFNGNANAVALGQVVQVRGTAGEFQGQTQIAGAVTIEQCGSTDTVAARDVVLPVPAPIDGVAYLERFEGMMVRFPQTLSVTEHFQLGRFGQVTLSSGGRLPQPTQVAAPGVAAQAVQAANDLNRVIVDDAVQNQNADPIVFGRLGNSLTAANTLRGGDTVADLTGVLSYTWAGNAASGNAFRVRPVGDLSDVSPGGGIPVFQPTNPRPEGPPAVGGSTRIASFNVLNYFLTLDNNQPRCGPPGFEQECRGAESAVELTRQRDKLLSALVKLDADIIGLIELENTPGVDPLADIVAGLNLRVGSDRFAAIDTGVVGTDAIRVGLLYDHTAVTPVGPVATLTSAVDPRFDDTRNRPALAQTFATTASGARLTAVVNHLKSKGASGLDAAGSVCVDADPANDLPDCDQGDGQGYWNASRTNAARALADWLRTDPTGSADADVVILGDLNAYAKEDPVEALRAAGYADVVETASGYSFAFDGQWGSLDHALASPSLASQVTGAGEYHINADEPNVLDYNTNFKSANHVTQLYAPDEFRTADHDPLLAGVGARAPYQFTGVFPSFASPPVVTRFRAGVPLPLSFRLGDFRGLDVFAGGSPTWEAADCVAPSPTGQVIAPVRPLAGIGLRYVRPLDTYAYLAETSRAWAGQCRALVVQLDDTSVHRAYVQFVR